MGIDYSDIINGITIFLLCGLCATFFVVILYLYSENEYLKNRAKKQIIKDLKVNE